MTTTLRGTPGLSVAPTQNTAPVFEFRCLYTYDLRKKKKIWHDGSLRFHTFNRRVMVYDESKNYIGDAHWRETGDFLEGEELRLDKGVMVEVGEQIGHTETDLAPVILEKRRPELASSPPRASVSANAFSSGSRPMASLPQARPKSLAAVLGASQGPIGRARLPARSPFEQRQNNIPHQSEARPAKRPRPATGNLQKENLVHARSDTERIPISAGQALVRANVTRKLSVADGNPSMVSARPSERSAALSQRPTSIPSDRQQGGHQHQANLIPEEIRPPGPSFSDSTARFGQKSASSRMLSATRRNQATSQSTSAKREDEQIERSISAEEFPSEILTASKRSSERVVINKLRFAKEKPRRKLICKDLLQRDRYDRTRNSLDLKEDGRNQDLAEKRRVREERGARDELRNSQHELFSDSPIVDLLSASEDDSATKVQNPLLRDLGRADSKSLSPCRNTSRSPSPLFVGETLPSTLMTLSQPSCEEDFEPPQQSYSARQRVVHCESTEVPQISQAHLAKDAIHLEDSPPAKAQATVTTAFLEVPSKLTLSDQRLLQKTAAAQSPAERSLPHPSLKQRPMRRILSESDSYLHRETDVFSIAAPQDTISTSTSPMRCDPGQPQRAFKSPIKVQRSVSDVTHLAQRRKVPERGASIIAPVAAAFDPWSEVEAYLLFDLWPPGKKKPSFAINES
jgi:Protein of unknown function (DUF2439)